MFCKVLLVCLSVSVVTGAQAQQCPPAVRAPIVDFSKVEIKTTRHSDTLFTLEGQGGTISVLAGPDGVLMVDGQFAQLTDKIVGAIKRISDQPIRFLVNTHVHSDHTGGNENFSKVGATILSRDQLRQRLANPSPGPLGRTAASTTPKALPIITYEDRSRCT